MATYRLSEGYIAARKRLPWFLLVTAVVFALVALTGGRELPDWIARVPILLSGLAWGLWPREDHLREVEASVSASDLRVRSAGSETCYDLSRARRVSKPFQDLIVLVPASGRSVWLLGFSNLNSLYGAIRAAVQDSAATDNRAGRRSLR